MSKFSKYYNGTIEVEVQSLIPERVINYLWNRGAGVRNIRKINITTLRFYIDIKDYDFLEEASKKTNSKIKIIGRKGAYFLYIKLKRYITLSLGAIMFLFLIYYMSTFIWSIDIQTEKYLSPYEVRQALKDIGVRPGVKKKNIDVTNIEEEMKKREDIMWVRARIEGAKMKVKVAERQSPPIIKEDNSINNIIAKMDGEIIRIYTTSGTPLVKAGDLVKKDQLLIKAEQGKEGATYVTNAEGDVLAKTFYEFTKSIKLRGKVKERTGNSREHVYLELFGKKLYFKKEEHGYKQWEIAEEGGNFIKKVIYYELKEIDFEKDEDKVIQESVEELKKELKKELPIEAKVLDNIVNKSIEEDTLNMNIVFIVEQNISLKQILQ
ncbi:sporulation protein YqfD [Clostridium sp. MSJ-4]|uniref:Sporulation protein YqfD n=1 Tax=Clostridium simiarum TaxID=2841506 RepID=A0ABS6EZF1_9CLOT|nr:sporulation protein YqfD [Clostridium simiarum]MBU5591024.1 sporulation protein YqfD [Clostridium simiarum]